MNISRLIIASNRGPYRLQLRKHGLRRERSLGGLVTSVLPIMERWGGVWIAWGEPEGIHPSAREHSAFKLKYLSLSAEQVNGYYDGISNSALWPLCHSFLGRVRYNHADWKVYEEVNRRFARAILEEMEEDDVVWIHDYHLTLVPLFVRQERPSAHLVFFWHIPFPASEIFRTFPWRNQVMQSLLSCDFFGVHIPEYARDFMDSAKTIVGAETNHDCIFYGGRTTRVLARPIGIDADEVQRLAGARRATRHVREIGEMFQGQTVILGVERMDYTKGVVERLEAMERLLEEHPEFRGKVTLIQIVAPSRIDVEDYRRMKRRIDETVGRINGHFTDGAWIPIRYLYRSFSLSDLVAYYRIADVALVTPLRDGLNLVAKEYVAARTESDGVLILSEFAGVAYQLPEALIVNPYSLEEMAEKLRQALLMNKEEQQRRMRAMQARIKEQDFSWWTRELLDQIDESQVETSGSNVLARVRQHLSSRGHVWLFLDYDGTLVPTAPRPDEALPDPALLALLARLTRVPLVLTAIISGRSLASLQKMLDLRGLILAGLYGVEVQLPNRAEIIRAAHETVRPLIEAVKRAWAPLVRDRKGLFIEDKGLAVALHARLAEPEDAEAALSAAQTVALELIAGEELRLLGGYRIIEVAPRLAHKGQTVNWLLEQDLFYDVLPIYLGDDEKDEEAFTAVRQRGGIPIAVGQYLHSVQALAQLPSPAEVRRWLELFAKLSASISVGQSRAIAENC